SVHRAQAHACFSLSAVDAGRGTSGSAPSRNKTRASRAVAAHGKSAAIERHTVHDTGSPPVAARAGRHTKRALPGNPAANAIAVSQTMAVTGCERPWPWRRTKSVGLPAACHAPSASHSGTTESVCTAAAVTHALASPGWPHRDGRISALWATVRYAVR